MLNEQIEFENYTYPLYSNEPVCRLKHSNLSNSLSGVTRAMTIIARKCYFDESAADKREHCKNTLRVWFGDPRGDEEKSMEGIIENWLPKYVIKILANEKFAQFREYMDSHKDLLGTDYDAVSALFDELCGEITANPFPDKERRKDILIRCDQIKSIIDKNCEITKNKNLSVKFAPVKSIVFILNMMRNRCGNKGFNSRMFNEKPEKSDKNDYKKITYDKIIADAVRDGKLERYYLICESEELDEVAYKDEYPFSKKKKKSKTARKKADLLRKVVAAYLLEKERHTDSSDTERFIPVNFSDIRNWLVSDITINLEVYSWKKNPLFEQEIINGNQKQIRINREWMDRCGWRIIREEESEDYLAEHPETDFYSDWGAGQMLKKNYRY